MDKLEELLELICEMQKVSPEKVKSQSRLQEVVEVRHLFHYFACKYFEGVATLEKIAKVTNRNYATVINSRNRVIPKWQSLNKQGRPFNLNKYNVLQEVGHTLNDYYNLNDELTKRRVNIQMRMKELQEELKSLNIEALIQERKQIEKQIAKLKS